MKKGNRLKAAAFLLAIFSMLGLLSTALFRTRPYAPSAHDGDPAAVGLLHATDARIAPATDEETVRMAPLPTVARQVVPVRTTAVNAAGQRSSGTGVIVSPGLVVTPAHILTEIPGAEIEPVAIDCDGRTVGGLAVHLDRTRDVAVISARYCAGETIAFAPPPARGAAVRIAGYGFATGEPRLQWGGALVSDGVDFSPDRAVPAANAASAHFRKVYEAMRQEGVRPLVGLEGMQLSPGNSGSVAYDDAGRLVGIVIAGTDAPYAAMVPAATVEDVLRASGAVP